MITYKAKERYTIELGRQGENLCRCVEFDISKFKQEFGQGQVKLLVQRPTDIAPYSVAIMSPLDESDIIRWIITSQDTIFCGKGMCQLVYMVEDVIIKTTIYKTMVLPSLNEV